MALLGANFKDNIKGKGGSEAKKMKALMDMRAERKK